MKKDSDGIWASDKMDIKSVDWRGDPILIRAVPIEKNSKTGAVLVDPSEVVKSQFRGLATEFSISDRDIWLLILLYAKPGPFQRGYLCQKYKLNKMLFYQWKELEKDGLGDAIIHDEFIPYVRGPVPKSLWEDLERLYKNEILDVTGGGKKVKKTVTVELTQKGERIAKKLWELLPDPYLSITTRVKDWLFPLDPGTIKERVHRDYPEYRKTYKKADREEVMKFKITETVSVC